MCLFLSDIPLPTGEEAEDNSFVGGGYKKKDEPKTLDNIKTKFYVATEV